MEPSPSGKSQARWSTIVLGVGWLLGQALPTPFGFGKLLWIVPEMASLVLTVLALVALAGLLLLALAHWRHDRPWTWVILCLVLLPWFVTKIAANERLCYGNRFRQTSLLRFKAEQWIGRGDFKEGMRRSVPGDLRSRTFGRPAFISRGQALQVYFPHFSFSDNSEGFVYSPNGKPPERAAFFETVFVDRLDDHWFWIRTT